MSHVSCLRHNRWHLLLHQLMLPGQLLPLLQPLLLLLCQAGV
jgi:hypothetical protein